LSHQKYLRRRRFSLHTAFINATMISEIDAPVEFEVSIGNYGNKLDDQLPASVSTTQPTNAVFDGCHYYFLPWGDSKPCVTVDCQWEDVTFRLETVNLLLTIVDKLVRLSSLISLYTGWSKKTDTSFIFGITSVIQHRF